MIALAIRLGMASQLLPVKSSQYFYRYNESARIAWALVSGHGYSSPWPDTLLLPTAQQPPIYPLLLACIFKVFGAYTMASLWTAVVLNAIIAGMTAVSILAIGRRQFTPTVGILAAWIWSCWLYEAAVSLRLWENAISALWLSLSFLLLPVLATATSASLWLLFGLLVGVSVLTNTSLLAPLSFFWLWLWFRKRRLGHSTVSYLLLSVATCLFVVTPWTIRNYSAFHRLIPVRDNFGLEFWLGNHEGVSNRLDNDFPALNPAAYNRLGEIAFMESKRQIGLQFVREHPGQFVLLSLRRLRLFWTVPEGSLWWLVSALAWPGAWLFVRHNVSIGVPYVVTLLAFPLVYYVTHVFTTYRHPIEPEMLLLATYAVVAMASTLRTSLRRTRMASIRNG